MAGNHVAHLLGTAGNLRREAGVVLRLWHELSRQRNSTETSNQVLALLPLCGKVTNTPTQSAIANTGSRYWIFPGIPRLVPAPLNCEGSSGNPQILFPLPGPCKEIILLGFFFFFFFEIQLTDISEKSHVNHSNETCFYYYILASCLLSCLLRHFFIFTQPRKRQQEDRAIGAVPLGVLFPHHGYQTFEEPPCQRPQSRCTGEAEVPGLAFQKLAALKSPSSIVRKDARPRLSYSFDTLKWLDHLTCRKYIYLKKKKLVRIFMTKEAAF